MSVTVQPLACGTLTAPMGMFEAGGSEEPIEIPVPAWLIHHPRGLVLFDTGMSADLTEPGPRLDLVSRFFDVECTTNDLVDARLAAAEVHAADVDIVIASHLHFDHIGGLALVPNARLVVHRDEWAAVNRDPPISNLDAQSALVGHDVVTVDGEHDLFGDGRVVTVPTPGHTPGHQSLRVRTDREEIVLCGDCAYFSTTLDGGPLPAIGHDLEQQARSVERLRGLRDGGATVIPGHDPVAFATLPAML